MSIAVFAWFIGAAILSGLTAFAMSERDERKLRRRR
jgi:hypothetical protein